jgi:hypothetical protein
MLHAMSFDEIVANNMVILGSGETVANAILELASRLDLMGLALIFKHGAIPYHMVERSMRTWRRCGAEDPACSRPRCRC